MILREYLGTYTGYVFKRHTVTYIEYAPARRSHLLPVYAPISALK